VTIALGIIHGDRMDSPFVHSLARLMGSRDVAPIFVRGGAGRLDNSRNEVVRVFLETSAQRLLWLDTDMVFHPEHYDALAARQHPIVSGLYFVDSLPPRAAAANTATDGGIRSISDWKDGELVGVDWCGSGFMLADRVVYEKLGKDCYRQDVVAPSGSLVGEDYAFCQRAREAGFEVVVDTSVFVGHVKPRILGWE
jgi:hypothetical protein